MSWEIEIENIAGIRRGEAHLEPGINAVRGGNWQGKSSFLRALQVAMGTDTALTEDASDGRVHLSGPDSARTIGLRRENGTVVSEGEPYLDDEYDRLCASLFAFLDEDNEVRATIRRGESLEDVFTRPLDFEDIERQIRERKQEREQVQRQLEDANAAAKKLPRTEERIATLEEELDSLRTQRDQLEDGPPSESADHQELTDARAERDQLESRRQRLADAVERIEDKRAELREEHDSLTVPDVDAAEELQAVREEYEQAKRDKELLESVYATNSRLLDEDRLDLLADVERGLLEDSVTCWVCGSTANREQFEMRLEAIAERITELSEEVEGYETRIEALEEKREEAKQAKRHKRDIEDQLADTERTLDDRRESLSEITEQLAAIEERIEELEATVDETSEQVTAVESDIKVTEHELFEARETREKLETEASQREQLREQHERLSEEIESLRERKERIRHRTREAFDEAIEGILSRFDTSFETARLTSDFELVVAREGREASLDALSEGELELLGVVAALAGFEAFEVGDRVPILMLDALGGLTDESLHTLVDYLEGRSEYLVFTTYPEHAAFEGHEISPSSWRVVSAT